MKKCSYCGIEYPDDAVMCAIDHTSLDNRPVSLGKEHSGAGIASFIISIAVGCLMMAMLCVTTILAAHRIPGERTYPGQAIVGLLIMFLAAVDVVAIALGIVALCQAGKNQLFGILGLVFSSLTILGVTGLMIIGLMYMSRVGR